MVVQEVVSIQIIIETKLFVLGIYPKIFVNMCLVQAKRLIALIWKSNRIPNFRQWFKEMPFYILNKIKKSFVYLFSTIIIMIITL